jgi:hypothetical protein
MDWTQKHSHLANLRYDPPARPPRRVTADACQSSPFSKSVSPAARADFCPDFVQNEHGMRKPNLDFCAFCAIFVYAGFSASGSLKTRLSLIFVQKTCTRARTAPDDDQGPRSAFRASWGFLAEEERTNVLLPLGSLQKYRPSSASARFDFGMGSILARATRERGGCACACAWFLDKNRQK